MSSRDTSQSIQPSQPTEIVSSVAPVQPQSQIQQNDGEVDVGLECSYYNRILIIMKLMPLMTMLLIIRLLTMRT